MSDHLAQSRASQAEKRRLRAKAVDTLGAAEFSNPVVVRVNYKPIVLSNFGRTNEAYFQFDASPLAPGKTYTVLSSPDNLKWDPIGQIYSSNPKETFIDIDSSQPVIRFYKVKLEE